MLTFYKGRYYQQIPRSLLLLSYLVEQFRINGTKKRCTVSFNVAIYKYKCSITIAFLMFCKVSSARIITAFPMVYIRSFTVASQFYKGHQGNHGNSCKVHPEARTHHVFRLQHPASENYRVRSCGHRQHKAE